MKEIVCLQVYKRILKATFFSTVAGFERESMGLSKCCQLCQAYGGNFTNLGEGFVLTEPMREA